MAMACILILIGSVGTVFFAQKIPQQLFQSWHQECTDYLCAPIMYQALSQRKRLISALLFLLLGTVVYWRFQDHFFAMISSLIFTCMLLIASIIDIDYKILPDQLTLGLLWIGLITNCFVGFAPLSSAIFGAAFGYVSLLSVYHAYRFVTKKEGLGYGDFKLLAAVGGWLGTSAIPITLLIASVLACFTMGIYIILFKADHQKPFPFGPFLAIAGWFILVGKPWLMHFFPFLI